MKLVNNAELNLVRSILDAAEFGNALFRGVKGEHFVDAPLGQVWDFILNHWSEYNKIPAHETVFEFFPALARDIVKVSPKEPADFYAQSILEAFARRGLVDELLTVLPLLETDIIEATEAARKIFAKYEIIREGVDVYDLLNTAQERWDEYHREDIQGIPFGWDTLDEVTMGAQKGQLIGFVARGGQGKSWVLLFNALVAWKHGYKVMMIATELPHLDMLRRLDALHLGCNYNLFKKQLLPTETVRQYQDYLFEGTSDEDKQRFKIVNGYGLSTSAINVLVDQYKPDILFIDGVYLLESDAKYRDDWQKIRYLANELKHKVARKHMIPVVFNTQFGRNVGTAVGKSKKVQGGVEDIGYGDEFGKASDLLISVYRDDEDLLTRLLSLTVIKGREISDGIKWKVKFNFEMLSFTEHVETEPDYSDNEVTEQLEIMEQRGGNPW